MQLSLNSYYSFFKEENFHFLKLEDLYNNANIEEITKSHSLNYYTFLLVTTGIGTHSIDFKEYNFSHGTFLTIRKNITQKFHLGEKVKGYLIFFNEEFLHNYLGEFELSKTIHSFNEFLTSSKTQLMRKDFIEVLYLFQKMEIESKEIKDNFSNTIIRSKIHILINKIHRFKSRGYDKTQLSKQLKDFIKFQDFLESNFFKTKKVKDYSDLMGFSSKKLNGIIKYVTNKPAKEFIDDFIITKIKKELLFSNNSIKEIAFKFNFNESTNFFKYFKGHTNYTPDEFRKRFS